MGIRGEIRSASSIEPRIVRFTDAKFIFERRSRSFLTSQIFYHTHFWNSCDPISKRFKNKRRAFDCTDTWDCIFFREEEVSRDLPMETPTYLRIFPIIRQDVLSVHRPAFLISGSCSINISSTRHSV